MSVPHARRQIGCVSATRDYPTDQPTVAADRAWCRELLSVASRGVSA